MIPQLIYILCILTCFGCAFLLMRAFRRNKARLLFWSALHFLILGFANIVLFLDMAVIREVELLPLRTGLTLVAVLVLLYGLIFEAS
ncbi:MAG TPA: DUF5985 family protein [Verrucomicrobiales bacterium]|jgi:hypothetical protein|nr:DUF5985 family protein [Verrucomicrobiales bacterium]